MNSRQESKVNMYRGVLLFCQNNAGIVLANTAFSEAINALTIKVNEIQDYLVREIRHTTGISADKATAKAKLCLVASEIANIVYAYANTVNNKVLIDEVNYSLSDLKKLREDLIVATVTNIYNSTQSNLSALGTYGITASTLDELTDAINDYNALLPKTKTTISEKSNYNDNIIKLIDETDTLIKNRLDRLVVVFNKPHPDFVNTYKKVRHIDAPNKTVTQIKGNVINKVDGKAIEEAIISLIGSTNATTKSDKEGNFVFKPVTYGDYQLSIKATGFKDYIDTAFVVKMGKVNRVFVGLEG